MLKTEDINNLIGVDDSWKAPSVLMHNLLDKALREKMFRDFLKLETDLSYDWFHEYFEAEAAQRKQNKQDFTPTSVTNLLSRLVGDRNGGMDPTAGTGGILITKWWADIIRVGNPIFYLPAAHFYRAEELSDRAIPFLLFNLAIRGMNAVVIHVDVLSRENCKGIYFIQNASNSAIDFSNINLMPRTEQVMHEFGIKSWDESEPAIDHIEDTKMPNFIGEVIANGKSREEKQRSQHTGRPEQLSIFGNGTPE